MTSILVLCTHQIQDRIQDSFSRVRETALVILQFRWQTAYTTAQLSPLVPDELADQSRTGRNPNLDNRKFFLKAAMFSAILPYLAVTSGWILTETGRWPWIVYGLQKIEDGVSPNVPAWNIAVSLALMFVLYSILTAIAVRLAVKYGTSDVRIKDTSADD